MGRQVFVPLVNQIRDLESTQGVNERVSDVREATINKLLKCGPLPDPARIGYSYRL